MPKHAQESSLDSSSDQDDFISPSLPPILPQPEHWNKHKKSERMLVEISLEPGSP